MIKNFLCDENKMEDIKILIVDDKDVDAMDIKNALESFGYSIPYIASTCEEAVDKATELLPDLILLDIALKDDNEAISKVKELDLPVIYLTANSKASKLEKTQLADHNNYINTPLDSNELKYTIKLAIYKNKMEKELKSSEEKFRRLAENSKDMIYKMTIPDGEFLYVNPAAEDITGYTLEEFYNSTRLLKKSIHPDHRDYYKNTWEKLLEGEIVPVYEYKIITNSGEVKWLNQRNTVITDNEGNPIAIEGIVTDITERKDAEETLKINEEKYRQVFNKANDAMFLHKLDNNGPGKFLDVNNLACEILGYTRNELLQMSPKDIDTVETMAKTEEVTHTLMNNRKITFEAVQISKNGKRIPFEIKAHIFTLRGENYVLSIARDIGERRKAENKIKASLEEKEILLKEIHHRVKNNLQIVSSLLNLQTSYIDDDNVALDLIKGSQNRIKSMAMIHEKLYQSKNFSHIQFDNYIEKLISDLFYSYATTKNIDPVIDVEAVELNIENAIPCGLIINELISNSLKYAFPNQRNGKIYVSLKKHDGEYDLTVGDDGIGFPDTLDYTKTDTLGLKLVTSLVDQINGKMSLDRSHGTRFNIKFKASDSRRSI